jgi:hypothetical protein
MDLQLPDFVKRAEKFRESLRGKRYFLESWLIKLYESYIRVPISDQKLDRDFRALVADLMAELSGKRGGDRERAVGKEMQAMAKKRLIEAMREH